MKNFSIFLLLLVILTGCSELSINNNKTINNTNSETQANTDKNTNAINEDNSKKSDAKISCQVDGETKNFTANITASEMNGTTSTVLMAFNNVGDFIQIVLPKREAISFTQADPGIGLHFGMNQTRDDKVTFTSFESNLTDGTDQVTLNVTKYDSQIIEGTFSGSLTEINTDGFTDKKISITGGIFVVTDIKPL